VEETPCGEADESLTRIADKQPTNRIVNKIKPRPRGRGGGGARWSVSPSAAGVGSEIAIFPARNVQSRGRY
jgi:hypothetical protein